MGHGEGTGGIKEGEIVICEGWVGGKRIKRNMEEERGEWERGEMQAKEGKGGRERR